MRKFIFRRRSLLLLSLAVAALVAPAQALAAPPTLSSVGQQNRHPTATFSAPRSDDATIYVATKPDRATDGRFLDENLKTLAFLTDSELQSGQWLSNEQLDPGTYWVMLRTSANFGSCYSFDTGGFDPACADGFSNVMQLVVPEPAVRYSAGVTVYKYLNQVDLRLAAAPLGTSRSYRLCYQLRSGRTRCLTGTLDGFDWNSGVADTLTVSKQNLPRITTFNWYVGGKRVATKRVLIRR
jgi:hypothetical protein